MATATSSESESESESEARQIAQSGPAWIVLGVLAAVFLLIATFDSGGPREGADRVQYLSTVYACPQCNGQSVAESNAAVAATIRDFIRVEVSAGATDQEIRDELIRAYGSEVLLTPPAEGVSLVIWILPVVVVVGGAALVVSIVRRRGDGLRAPTRADESLVADALAESDGPNP